MSLPTANTVLNNSANPVLPAEAHELTCGRKFDCYMVALDAGLDRKCQDILPHVQPGRIVDKGCGTGRLLSCMIDQFPGSELIGVDLSDRLLQAAHEQNTRDKLTLVQANIIDQYFENASLWTVIFSSVVHEIFSYNNYSHDMVRLALKNTRAELAPGGRMIIRDGVKPEPGNVWMLCDAETEERFPRFARDFKRQVPSYKFPFTKISHKGRTWFGLDSHHANEFLSKKDFLANWDLETQEEFGVFTLKQWREELTKLDFRILQAYSYLNPWVLEHRYQNHVQLYSDRNGLPGEPIAYPDTTAVIVAAVPDC